MNYSQPMRLLDYNGRPLLGGTVTVVNHREYDGSNGPDITLLPIYRRRNSTWEIETPTVLDSTSVCPGFWFAGCADIIVKDKDSTVLFEMNGIGDPPALVPNVKRRQSVKTLQILGWIAQQILMAAMAGTFGVYLAISAAAGSFGWVFSCTP